MAEVLLTHSNHLWSDRKQVAKMQPYPPLQTILAAAVLRANGISVGLFDPTLVPRDEPVIRHFEAALETHRPRLVLVCEDDFNFLSKMCLTRNRELAFAMARGARASGIEAVVHGSDASDRAPEYLAAGFSAVLIGEVEETLLEIARCRDRRIIRGLALRNCNSVHYTPPRLPSRDLDLLPLPAWDLVDVEAYRQAWNTRHGYFSLNMAASRGCPYHCNWCAKPIYGQSYRSRGPWSVASEMALLKRLYKPDQIWFADDIFSLSRGWIHEFSMALDADSAHIPFRIQSRCDLMTEATAGALCDCGCTEVWMGAESGSQRILNAMEKGITVDQIYTACTNLRRHGIRMGLFLQFGYPGEKWEDIEATIRMVRDCRPDDVGISVSYPLPGTKFHKSISAQLQTISNWSDSADLAMMFRGSYSTEFYRLLTDALHTEVRGGDSAELAWARVAELESQATLSEAAAR